MFFVLKLACAWILAEQETCRFLHGEEGWRWNPRVRTRRNPDRTAPPQYNNHGFWRACCDGFGLDLWILRG